MYMYTFQLTPLLPSSTIFPGVESFDEVAQ